MSDGPRVGIVSTGVANLASVQAALARIGAVAESIETAEQVRLAERIILPGVGAFAAAMQRLQSCNLVDALRERIAAGRPTLAICLGLQLFAEASDESPGVSGLGIWPVRVQRLRAARVPQLGWNLVQASADSLYVRDGYAYFANSYGIQECPEGWRASSNRLEEPWVAAAERGDVLACQFHPELSGAWGDGLLRRWLGVGVNSVREAARC